MDSIAVMAGKLAHEIKNPLNVIYMNLQLLQEEWQEASTPKERRLLQKMAILKQEAQRLRDILDDFLRYARPASLRLETADLNSVVEEVVDFIRPDAMSRNIRILASYSSRCRSCRIDRNLFKQALLNILLNALEAMADPRLSGTGVSNWLGFLCSATSHRA
jgi:signal transduction histidine kinase